MIAESFLDVIGIFNFLDFHIPVIVSITIAKPIKKSMPVIGKKKVDTTANNWRDDFCIEDTKIDNCSFIRVLR